jgi:diguanylate cyclase (GGDEF)-like protein
MQDPETPLQLEEQPARSNAEFVKRYVGIISLVTIFLIIVIFWGFNSRQTNLLKQQMVHEARAFFQEIVQTSHWIISQGGVYVKVKPGMRVDSSLDKIGGLQASITDGNGEKYLLRNHAAITRMISGLASEERLFGINITSLAPLNPGNKPDAFEQAALTSFEEGTEEVYEFVQIPGNVFFRYMAPLLTEEECLQCHGQQGYELGDIRGGISISIPADRVMKEIYETRAYILISALALLALLLSLTNYIARRFIYALDRAGNKLIELATTDPLTGLLNRREGRRRFQQEILRSKRENGSLAVIIIDIDLFKQVNDNFGHLVGDEAIKRVSGVMVATLRGYDIICRYGGEEFLIVLPATGLTKALETAERLRRVVENEVIETRIGKEFRLTISCGVSVLQPGESLDSLVYKADNALYIAKEEGRNQVQHII